MIKSDARLSLGFALGMAVALTLAACGGQNTSSGQPSGGGRVSQAGQAGGTIYILMGGEQFTQVDPQRLYSGEDLAFFGGTIMRSLTAYKFSPDATEGTSLTPDLATDLGTATDGGTTWAFTLRDDVTWQDGTAITCADLKYGASRTFATDVINQGPTYAIAYLHIPYDADGSSSYKGPYKGTGQELYDKAVVCDGKTITFHLNRPVADFNYTVTLGFAPVRKADDTGETYGTVAPFVVSSGPYKVQEYSPGVGGKMVLVRNDNWNPASDPYRGAFPDKWEVDFGIDAKFIDQRIIQSSGNDKFAIQYGALQPENLAVVFQDQETPTAQFAGRAVSGFDPYADFYWINIDKVKNVKIRQAMAVALDRAAIRLNVGGAFAGDYADGFIKPNIGADYAPTGFWTDFFGQAVPDSGDPTLARKLIADSGEPAPKLVFNYADISTNQRTAAIVIDSLGKARITVTPAPLDPSTYASIIFDPAKAGDFGLGGWGADWPNASTVIPPLFTVKGGWDLSRVNDADFNAQVDAAATELDRAKQATLWQALNKEAVENVWAIPTFFGRSQTIAGTGVAPAYRWAPYGSWPYGAMYVKP
jgi:peptide/nickel transport system substrate-binding protein